MPQTRAPLPYKVAFSLGGVEWRVEKLGRVQLDPRRNARARKVDKVHQEKH